ncbi:alpha/beta hydrolase [Hwanghaeella grinnelliae]|uniref:Alpha/beta hydrolase n=2 Tax=Hwanghaeella grinnelliae TaxID=2500179 RepID=A0A437QZ18_9PROT|nr:alpha/beta hydrolase [Hwanghaeella grinnelliae]
MDFLSTGPVQSSTVLILAHGAGAPMDSPFMNAVADGVATAAIRCVRFEFPYMAGRRHGGKKRPPDRQPVLLDHFQKVIQQISETAPKGASIYIGGKSMGGRMATLLAAQAVEKPLFQAVLCLGYPFHPPGKPEKTRTDHFPEISCPVLVCQGDRDPFGTRAEIENYALPSHVQFCWLPDGNHDLAPRVKSGYTKEENLAATIAAMVDFMEPDQPR